MHARKHYIKTNFCHELNDQIFVTVIDWLEQLEQPEEVEIERVTTNLDSGLDWTMDWTQLLTQNFLRQIGSYVEFV